MKKVVLGFLSFVFLFFLVPRVYADNNFATSFTGTYNVEDSGVTHAVFNVNLKNLTDKFYATSYTLQLGFSDIENIHATDPDGAMTPTLKQTTDGDELTFTFNHRAIGLGVNLPFTFSFDTTNVATKNGSIWEVDIPGVQDQNDFADFLVSVNVPPDFGAPVYVKPDVGSGYTFTKDELGKSGISLAFGQQQVFHFNLSYHLRNSQIFPVTTEIALPPNTSYQDVAIDTISPKPQNVVEDNDGNYLARYNLLPSQLLTVHVDGRAFLSLHPQKQTLSPQQVADYLKPSTYWQTTNSSIVSLSQQLKTPYAIYEYVVHTLHYDFSRVSDNQERLGAVDVLQNPSSAVCLEFTDLFIALARAAGIPAREVDGYAYTQNSRERPLSLQKDILHAWPEYYDQTSGAWIMVDPTWENTTGGVDYFHVFDFDHIAFVIKGENPDYPIPAGGYKLSDQQDTHDVTVDFADNVEQPHQASTVDVIIPTSVTGGLPVDGSLEETNTAGVLFPSQSVKIISGLPYFSSQSILAPEIPPFGTETVPFHLGKTPFLTNSVGTVTILIGSESITKQLAITPFSLFVVIIGGGILGIFSIIILIITTRSRRVSVSE